MGRQQLPAADCENSDQHQDEADPQAEGEKQENGEEELVGLMQANEDHHDARSAGQEPAGDPKAQQLLEATSPLIGVGGMIAGLVVPVIRLSPGPLEKDRQAHDGKEEAREQHADGDEPLLENPHCQVADDGEEGRADDDKGQGVGEGCGDSQQDCLSLIHI